MSCSSKTHADQHTAKSAGTENSWLWSSSVSCLFKVGKAEEKQLYPKHSQSPGDSKLAAPHQQEDGHRFDPGTIYSPTSLTYQGLSKSDSSSSWQVNMLCFSALCPQCCILAHSQAAQIPNWAKATTSVHYGSSIWLLNLDGIRNGVVLYTKKGQVYDSMFGFQGLTSFWPIPNGASCLVHVSGLRGNKRDGRDCAVQP